LKDSVGKTRTLRKVWTQLDNKKPRRGTESKSKLWVCFADVSSQIWDVMGLRLSYLIYIYTGWPKK